MGKTLLRVLLEREGIFVSYPKGTAVSKEHAGWAASCRGTLWAGRMCCAEVRLACRTEQSTTIVPRGAYQPRSTGASAAEAGSIANSANSAHVLRLFMNRSKWRLTKPT